MEDRAGQVARGERFHADDGCDVGIVDQPTGDEGEADHEHHGGGGHAGDRKVSMLGLRPSATYSPSTARIPIIACAPIRTLNFVLIGAFFSNQHRHVPVSRAGHPARYMVKDLARPDDVG
jgi:hypothetical protein